MQLEAKYSSFGHQKMCQHKKVCVNDFDSVGSNNCKGNGHYYTLRLLDKPRERWMKVTTGRSVYFVVKIMLEVATQRKC